MKTVDELMALADACTDAAHQAPALLPDARAALLTALQEVTSSEAMYQGWYEDAHERRADLELEVMALEEKLIECKRSVDAHMAQYSNFLNIKNTDITSEEQVEYNRLEELVAYLEHVEGQEAVHAIDTSAERVEKSGGNVQVQLARDNRDTDGALLRQALEIISANYAEEYDEAHELSVERAIRARLEGGV